MILIFNAGSSSLKAKLFDNKLKELKNFEIERIGSSETKDHTQAVKQILSKIDLKKVKVIGHRIVHGGDKYKEITEIDDSVIAEIEKLSCLAPLHNPPALEVIKEVQKYCHPEFISGSSEIPNRSRNKFGMTSSVQHDDKIKQFALFDTGFFNDLPLEAKIYPLPYEFYKKGIKKFGFHGISHQYAYEESLKHKNIKTLKQKNIITVHLGAGCSIAAIQNGKPIETSMGFTPNDGLMMMTRSGALDPSIIAYLEKEMKMPLEKIAEVLTKKSGLLGISGVSDDMRDILFVAGVKVEDKDYVMPANIQCDREHIKRSELAVEMFCRTVKKYIGGYLALLNNKVEALVFTGEIGYGSSILRERIAKDFGIKIMAVKPNEELAIARKIIKMV